MRFGIHAGPQDCSLDELRRLWRLADLVKGIYENGDVTVLPFRTLRRELNLP